MIAHFRPAPSTDSRVIQRTYIENGYIMPDDMTDQIVIDIGAHIGTFSVLCAERGAHVVAFEPHPENFKLLRRNTKDLTVLLSNRALGPTRGLVDLYLNPPNDGAHSTVLTEGLHETIKVLAVSLDDILLAYGPRTVDVLKMDCEGAEIYAVPALAKGLHKKVKRIVMEFHGDRVEQEALRAQLEPFYDGVNIFQGDWSFVHK